MSAIDLSIRKCCPSLLLRPSAPLRKPRNPSNHHLPITPSIFFRLSGVQYPLRSEPATPRGSYAVPHEPHVECPVGVRSQGEHDLVLRGGHYVGVIEVQPLRIGVYLQGDLVPLRRLEDLLYVDRIGLPDEQLPPGRVGEDVHQAAESSAFIILLVIASFSML